MNLFRIVEKEEFIFDSIHCKKELVRRLAKFIYFVSERTRKKTTSKEFVGTINGNKVEATEVYMPMGGTAFSNSAIHAEIRIFLQEYPEFVRVNASINIREAGAFIWGFALFALAITAIPFIFCLNIPTFLFAILSFSFMFFFGKLILKMKLKGIKNKVLKIR